LIKKVTKAKRAGSVAQVVENLSSKCEALSSNPSAAKRKKEQAPVFKTSVLPLQKRLYTGYFHLCKFFVVRSHLHVFYLHLFY
jgi:hypothetical protein